MNFAPMDQLRAENDRLRAENERLNAVVDERTFEQRVGAHVLAGGESYASKLNPGRTVAVALDHDGLEVDACLPGPRGAWEAVFAELDSRALRSLNDPNQYGPTVVA